MTENFRIAPLIRAADVKASDSLSIPKINSNMLPIKGVAGQIAYDTVTRRTWECVENPPGVTTWRPISIGGGSGSTTDFSLKKSGTQNIPSGVETIITSFSTTSPYFDITFSWNIISGVFTALVAQSMILDVDMTWAAGISNQGERSIRVYYKPFAGAEQLVKDSSTQASPSNSSPTTQDASVGIFLAAGDQVYVKALHNAGVSLTIDSTGTYSGHCSIP